MKGPNGGDNVTAGPQIGPARLKFEKIRAWDGGGDVDEEWDVIGREACARGKRGVRDGVRPSKVKENTI